MSKVDIKEFAKLIGGKEYGFPKLTVGQVRTAKENGFIIVYGCSDDLMEFRGMINDECDCYCGGKVFFNRDEVYNGCNKEKYPYWIKAIWCGGETDENGQEITWTYETDIPHETFMIYEDGEPYCRGIVFKVEDLK